MLIEYHILFMFLSLMLLFITLILLFVRPNKGKAILCQILSVLNVVISYIVANGFLQIETITGTEYYSMWMYSIFFQAIAGIGVITLMLAILMFAKMNIDEHMKPRKRKWREGNDVW